MQNVEKRNKNKKGVKISQIGLGQEHRDAPAIMFK